MDQPSKRPAWAKPRPLVPKKGPTVLQNMHCIYCGCDLTTVERNREHVIGQNFVPEGTLGNDEWNLIANSCVPCNSEKAELEDEISAVTMLPAVDGKWASDDPRLKETMLRKARGARSRETGKLVADSHAQHTVKFNPAPGVTMTFNMVGAPPVPRERFHKLARMHAVALFGMTTYRKHERRCYIWNGTYVSVAHASDADWGNERLRGFTEVTSSWDCHLWLNAAEGFFKVIIRKRPNGAHVWSFAVEWNKSHRVVGFFGHEDDAWRIAESLPKLEMRRADAETRFRENVPIRPGQDTLFHRPCWVDDHRATRTLDMREFPRSDSRRVGTLKRGDCVILLEKRRRWMRVSVVVDPTQNPVYGWVRGKYLTMP